MKAMCTCGYCNRSGAEATAYHRAEAERIERELERLGDEFAPDGIVRTVLRLRVQRERERAAANEVGE